MGDVDLIVDRNCPNVDEDKQSKVDELMEGEQVHKHVVGKRLSVSVQVVESVASKWSRNFPQMMRFVQVVQHGVM
jgi:hypothetical protein